MKRTRGNMNDRTLKLGEALALIGAIALAPGVAEAQTASAAPRLDEGYTLFELTDTEESENGARVWRGYSVTAHYRLFGTMPPGSAIVTVFKDGAREVGRSRCEGSAHDISDDAGWVGMTFECRDYEQRLRVVGNLTAETTFVDGRSDAETPLRTHTLNVREVAQAEVSPTHYVSRHQELLSAWITWHPANSGSYAVHGYFNDVPVAANVSGFRLVLPVAGDGETISALEGSRLRCTRDGQPVEFPNGDEIYDARGGRTVRLNQLQQNPDGYRQVEMTFSQLVSALPFVWGPNEESGPMNFSQNQGRWQCDLRNNGVVLRTFAFTVGADGLPVQHAEQAAGLYLGPRAAMVDITLPAAAAPHERTASAEVRAGGFYGRPWASESRRTASAATPNWGEAHFAAPRAAAPARPAAASPASGRRRR